MKSYHWMKLYNETLHDPKMQRLSDRLYRRTFECFMMASELNLDGVLPPIDEMAWELRVDVDILETELMNLSQTGIVSKVDGNWEVTNFSKRQSRISNAERQALYRDRQRKTEYYGNSDTESNDTITTCNTDKIRTDIDKNREDKDKTTTTSSSDIGQLVTAYEANIGAITAMVKDMLVDDLETYGLQLCLDAILKAVEQNKRKWSYVRGILKNIWTDGRGNGSKPAAEKRMQKTVMPDGQIVEVAI